VNNSTLNVRIFRTGHSSYGGGIGSSVRSCQDKEREREKKREKERRICFFLKRRDLRKREACDWKEGRKEGNEVREGREVRWIWMDGSGWMDIRVSTSGGRGDDRE